MMPQYNVHQAKSSLSQLLKAVERGEEVIISRHGHPVAQLVPLVRRGIVLGSGVGDANSNSAAGDDWWQPMSDEEADAFLDGRE